MRGDGPADHGGVPVPLASAAQQLHLLGEAAVLAAHDDSSVVTVLSPKAPGSQDRNGARR
ncbi:hypothetical protein O3S80_43995 [Streptomyces sp. Lzd4kr]|nr:hypothetical protein [Streptomyces sp. Lzd4kr]